MFIPKILLLFSSFPRFKGNLLRHVIKILNVHSLSAHSVIWSHFSLASSLKLMLQHRNSEDFTLHLYFKNYFHLFFFLPPSDSRYHVTFSCHIVVSSCLELFLRFLYVSWVLVFLQCPVTSVIFWRKSHNLRMTNFFNL